MALSKLSGDEAGIIFDGLRNVLEPRTAVYLSSASNELRTATQALLPQLRADHEAAAALGRKVGLRSCKQLREAKFVHVRRNIGFSATELATLGTLGSVLPALEKLILYESSGAAGPDGLQQLAAGLGAGALPTMTDLQFIRMHVGDAGASALAAALGRGALPRLKILWLFRTSIGDAGLVALAPALQRLPALERLYLDGNPIGDEGLAALVQPAGAPPRGRRSPRRRSGVLTKLWLLRLNGTQVADAGCAALAAALDSGALPALEHLGLKDTSASAAAKAAVGRLGLDVDV